MNFDTPQISFIVPVYASARYLRQCLDSILAQSVEKEIMIIDDGSPDEALQIALSYAARYPFITVVHSQNQGLSAARNKGVRLARGEFLFFVDSDDYLSGDRLAEVCALANHTQADIVKLQFEMFLDDHSESPYRWEAVSAELSENTGKIYHGSRYFVALSHKRWIPGVCWSLIRRRYLQQRELWFMEGIQAEDQIFYTALLTGDLQISVLELPLVVYHYRQKRQNSITNAQNNQSYIADLKRVIAWLEQWRDTQQWADDVRRGIDYVIEFVEFDLKREKQKTNLSIAK